MDPVVVARSALMQELAQMSHFQAVWSACDSFDTHLTPHTILSKPRLIFKESISSILLGREASQGVLQPCCIV